MKSCLILISLLFLVSSMPEPTLRSLSSYVNPITRVRGDLVNKFGWNDKCYDQCC
jgi:hypothetical protein